MPAAGTEKDLLVPGSQHTNYNTQNSSGATKQCHFIGINKDEPQKSHNQRKLSTFFGVVVPCCLSMFSVILYLRMGFIVGQAGMLESILMVILAYTIIGFTVLSISAISTNGAIEGGGAYFMISRALGPEFGGAIGLMFFLANAASSALYILGIVEAFASYFGDSGQIVDGLVPSGTWWNYLYGTIILLFCFVVCVVGADIYAKTTFLIFVVVMISIVSVIVSFFAKSSFQITTNNTLPDECNTSAIFYTGLNSTTLHENIMPGYTEDQSTQKTQNFILVFAVFFNGCTGIMAGANMSGDLKNPSQSIPVGTISACVITFVVYLVLLILISATTPRELLHCDYSFLLSINLWHPFVMIGVFASSLSAALSCLIGASRVLYALARDDLFGVVLRPVTKTTSNGNPITAVLATWFLIQITLFAGKVNTIAPIVTIFFLFSYAATDLACLALEWASAPNFRPTFKFFSWHTCLLGCLSCLVMMFLVNPIYASVSVIVIALLLLIIHYRVPTSSWGYISQALIFHQVRKYMLMLDIRKEHVKFWRPQILLMVKNPRNSCQLIDFINSIKKSGLFVIGHVEIGRLADMNTDMLSVDYQHWLSLVDYLGVKAFVELTLSRSVREGTEHLLRISGLGGMKPNTIVLGFYDECPHKDTFKDVAFSRNCRKRTGTKFSSVLSDLHSGGMKDDDDVNLFFQPPSGLSEHQLSADEYIAILKDALKLRKNVCLARYFNQLDKFTLEANKDQEYYIDVWPVNFLRPLIDVDVNTSSTSSSASFFGESFYHSSYFDTTCVFLMQMACILNMTPFWKKRTKLRIFLCVDPTDHQFVTPGDNEVEEFLKTVRINAEVKRVDWCSVSPSHATFLPSTSNLTVQGADDGKSLHASEPISSLIKDKSSYLKRVNSLIKSQHSRTLVTFLYLPAPPYGDSLQYLNFLTQLSDDLGPIFFVHGLSHVISTTL